MSADRLEQFCVLFSLFYRSLNVSNDEILSVFHLDRRFGHTRRSMNDRDVIKWHRFLLINLISFIHSLIPGFANGSSIAVGQGCNTDLSSYGDERSERYSSSFSDVNEQTSWIGNVIYATNHDELYARTIQSHQANLGLSESLYRIDLVCNNGLTGCALFIVGRQSETSSILATTSTSQATRLHSTFLFYVSSFLFFSSNQFTA